MSTFAKYVGGQAGQGGGGGGTVTSVGLSAPSIFTVSGSPVTTAGTLALALASESANTVFAGPSSGSPAAPTFRMLTVSDIPALSYVSSVSATSPLSSSGGLMPTISISQATTSTNGYLSSTDWNTFNSKQPSGNYAVGTSPTVVHEIAAWNNTSGTSLVSSGLQAYYNSSYGAIFLTPTNLSYPMDIFTENTTVAGYLSINAGSSSAGTGGELYLASGYGTTAGGLLELQAGNGSAGPGGAISILSGSGTTSGGGIGLTSGQGSAGPGGAINLAGGNGTNAAGGAIQIFAGAGTGTNAAGGGIGLSAGQSTGTASGGTLTLSAGNAGGTGTGGVVQILPGSSSAGVNSAGYIAFYSRVGGATIAGSMTGSTGLWTLGAAGSTVTHVVNGSLSFTGALLSGNYHLEPAEYTIGNSGGGPTINWAQDSSQNITINMNATFTFTNPVTGGTYRLRLISGGSFTATWPANVYWPNNTPPTLSTTSGYVDLITFYYDGTNYYGSYQLGYPV